MLEILITLVIVATALLGTAGLQVFAMRMNQSGQFRTQAIFLASDIAERMEANKAGSVAGNYVVALATAPSTAAANCGTGACDSVALASWDISQWGTAVNNLLPQASWQITRTTAGDPSTYNIVINWVDRRTDTNYGAYNAASAVGVNAAGTGERFSYDATRTVASN